MKKALVALTLLTLIISTANAGVIRHDRDDADYIALAQQEQFDPVGALTYSTDAGNWICSGTLIANRYVLTAAHCLDDSSTTDVSFLVGGNWYNGARWMVHENWNPFASLFAGWDIALLKLDSGVNNVNAANLYEGNSELGQVGTHVGYGATGTGFDGDINPPGTRRAGHNEIDEVNLAGEGHDRILWNDFDTPLGVFADDDFLTNPLGFWGYESGTALDLEYAIGGGDSGGGYFLEENGEWYVAGVHSFTAAVDGAADSTYGDFSGSTRVSSFTGWINQGQESLEIPAPNAVYLMLVGLAALFRARRS